MRIIPNLLAAAALVAAPTIASASVDPAKGEARLAHTLEGYVAGAPVDCLPYSRVQSSTIIDGTAIVYRSGSRLYVNRPATGADSLRSDTVLVTRIRGSQLCSIDTVTLVDRGSRMPSGFVALGKFVPYTRAAATR